jgi:hypothetical protein
MRLQGFELWPGARAGRPSGGIGSDQVFLRIEEPVVGGKTAAKAALHGARLRHALRLCSGQALKARTDTGLARGPFS